MIIAEGHLHHECEEAKRQLEQLQSVKLATARDTEVAREHLEASFREAEALQHRCQALQAREEAVAEAEKAVVAA